MEKRKINMREFMYELRGFGFPFNETQNILLDVGDTFYFKDEVNMRKYRVVEWKLISLEDKYEDEDWDIIVICVEINCDDDIERRLIRNKNIEAILK